MCRIYGNRIRVCKARGGPLWIGVEGAPWNDSHTHVLGQAGGRLRLRTDRERCPRCGAAMSDCRDRCMPTRQAAEAAGEGD